MENTYCEYVAHCKSTHTMPISKSRFDSINWLTQKHQAAWILANENKQARLALTLYNRLESARVSAQQQAKALSTVFSSIDLSDIAVSDDMHVDDFVNSVVQAFEFKSSERLAA